MVSITTVFLTGCSVFGVESVEEAPFQVVSKDKQFEIRDYEPLVAAETMVTADFKNAGNQAFRKLFKYISGDNQSSQKIAMTAPVIADSSNDDSGESIAMTAPVLSTKAGDQWRYQFVLPKGFTIDTAPQPTNPDVVIVEIPPKRVATVRYAGRATAQAQTKQAKVLSAWLVEQNLEPQSEPRWAGYNAPWTLPWFRRNEVLIDIPAP